MRECENTAQTPGKSFGIASSSLQIKNHQDWAKIGSVGLVETRHFFLGLING